MLASLLLNCVFSLPPSDQVEGEILITFDSLNERTPPLFHDDLIGVGFSPNESKLVTFGNGVRVWDVDTGALIVQLNRLADGLVLNSRFVDETRIAVIFNNSGESNHFSNRQSSHFVPDNSLKFCIYNFATRKIEVQKSLPWSPFVRQFPLVLGKNGTRLWIPFCKETNDSGPLQFRQLDLKDESGGSWSESSFSIALDLPYGYTCFSEIAGELWLYNASQTVCVDVEERELKWVASHRQRYTADFTWRYADGQCILFNPKYHSGLKGQVLLLDPSTGTVQEAEQPRSDKEEARLFVNSSKWYSVKEDEAIMLGPKGSIRSWALPFKARLLEVSPSGNSCVLASDGAIIVLRTNGVVKSGSKPALVSCMSSIATKQGTMIAVGGKETITIDHLNNGLSEQRREISTNGCVSCQLFRDGASILWVNDAGFVFVESADGAPARIPSFQSASSASFTTDEKSIVLCGEESDGQFTAEVWERSDQGWIKTSDDPISAVSHSLESHAVGPSGFLAYLVEEGNSYESEEESSLQAESVDAEKPAFVQISVRRLGREQSFKVSGYGYAEETIASYAVHGPTEKLAVLCDSGRLQIIDFEGNVLEVGQLSPSFRAESKFSLCGKYLVLQNANSGEISVFRVDSLLPIFRTRIAGHLAGVEVVSSVPPRVIAVTTQGRVQQYQLPRDD